MKQQLIVICTTDRDLVYDSVYNRDEAEEAATRAIERYGLKSNPRVHEASSWMRSHPTEPAR